MRHDIFSPPVASRIYAYSSIAGYEALRHGYPGNPSVVSRLNGVGEVPAPEAGKDYCFPLAAAYATLYVGKELVFSETDVESLRDELLQEFDDMEMPKDVHDRSVAYGETVAKHIMAWSKKDNYAQTRSAPKFTIETKDLGRWVPTPPRYEDALEPHWSEIRPWVMDSARQFKPNPPTPFSKDKNSAFYKGAMEVYNISKSLTEEQKADAIYWDCNPFEVTVSGHLMLGVKKISPGGHWMNITAHACRKADADIITASRTYAYVACALADAFISCWTCKYDISVVRPVTYLNVLVDPEWTPYIETPPFPEHTSGHATISASAATILTKTFGEEFTFTDSTEMEFGIPPRTFTSFYQASDQAAMSRLLGGIHYRNGNESGRLSGREIGAYIYETLSK